MTDPTQACAKCAAVHDPTLCKAHSKRQAGGQCKNMPMHGQAVCHVHGGRRGATKAAAATRLVAEQMRKELGSLTITPVDNPLVELQRLAGEARAWKELCAEHVAKLERMRYGTEGGEAIRGEIILFERALDRCAAVLSTIVKLDIDDRLVRIAEAQKNMILAAIEAGLGAVGVSGDQARTARLAAARHLRAVPDRAA